MSRKLLWGAVASLALSCTAGAAPSTQPALAQQPPPATNPVLLVLPIVPPAAGSDAWIARGIQQDLVADMAQMTKARVIAPPSAPAVSDEQAALDQGRQAGAGFVMYGESQVSGGQLRVTGQVLDVAAAKPLGALKATAPVDNLFPLEDSLAVQAAHALPPPIGMAAEPAQASPYTSPSTAGAAPQTPASPYVSASPSAESPAAAAPTAVAPPGTSPYYSYTEAVPPVYYTYNTYAYPYYAWGYPYYSTWPWYGGVGLWYGGGWYYGRGYWGGRYGRSYYGRPFYGGGFRGGAFHSAGGFHGGGGGHGGGHSR